MKHAQFRQNERVNQILQDNQKLLEKLYYIKVKVRASAHSP